MSIIHDALKKVQEKNPGQAPLAPVPSQDPAPITDPTKAPETFNIPLFVAAICAAIAMIFAILPHFSIQKQAAAPIPSAVTATAKEQPKPRVKPPQAAAPSSRTMAKVIASAVAIPSVPEQNPAAARRNPPPTNPVDPNDPLSSIQIEGVMDMGEKVALISGNIYEEGQTIYGRIITEITFDTFTIIDNGRKRTLRIKP